jgi:hypothetical protein
MQLFYQKQLMQPNMQLFPTTFLSKTAHAAHLEKKWKKKITINQPPIPTTTHHHHHLHTTTTTTTYLPTTTTTHHHLPTYLPTYLPTTTSSTTHTHTHATHTTSLSYTPKYSSTQNQALSIVLPGCYLCLKFFWEQGCREQEITFCYLLATVDSSGH